MVVESLQSASFQRKMTGVCHKRRQLDFVHLAVERGASAYNEWGSSGGALVGYKGRIPVQRVTKSTSKAFKFYDARLSGKICFFFGILQTV